LSRGFKPDIGQILITPGANAIIYFAIRCLVNMDEEVIVPDPGFPTCLPKVVNEESLKIPKG
jgi:aspartate/methionine/tyrosine aminotransferase